MKLISWNVNGLRACQGKAAIKREESKACFDTPEREPARLGVKAAIKREESQACLDSPECESARPEVSGFSEVFRELDADFFCLQETKMQPGQLDIAFDGYEVYWNSAEKKGYSGTAIFTRHKPIAVTYGIGIDEHDHEGRVITMEMEQFYLVCCYTPNSQDGLKRLDYRMTWERDFRNYLLQLDQKKPVILCGDLNVAHEEIDIKNPKTNRHNAGFTDEERQQFTTLLASGFTDTFRWKYPDQVTYSWWSYRFQARQKNAGWRIDYFVVSDRLRPLVTDAKIHTAIFGSDHCPVELDLEWDER